MIEYDCIRESQVIATMLDKQFELNYFYDKEWFSVPAQKYRIAAAGEYIEMIKEMNCVVRFYGEVRPSYPHKALEEFIDLFHFKLTDYLLSSMGTTFETDVAVMENKILVNDIHFYQPLDILNEIQQIVSRPSYTQDLIKLFYFGCKLFFVNTSTMFSAYMAKNDINKKRALNGAGTKNVDKTVEKPVYEQLFGANMVSMSPLKYDEFIINDCWARVCKTQS